MTSQFVTAFSEHHKFNSDLYNLEFPATILVYGEPKSGKTYFVLNLLKDIKKHFDEIIMYLGAKDSAPSFLNLIEQKKNPIIKILFNYNETDLNDYCKKLEDRQLELIKMKKTPKRILLLADDIYSFPSFMRTNRQNPSVIEKLFANYRHLNLSIIITSQRLKQIIPSVRSMFKYAFVCSLGKADIEELSKENENIYFDKHAIAKAYEQVRKREEAKGHIFFINKDAIEINRFQHVKPDNSIEIIKP
jgi:chromosomal replication initiation ATPase DnaA